MTIKTINYFSHTLFGHPETSAEDRSIKISAQHSKDICEPLREIIPGTDLKNENNKKRIASFK